MRHGTVGIRTTPRTGAVRQAIAFVTEKRTASYDALWRIDGDTRIKRIERLFRTSRVADGLFGPRLLAEVIGAIPIGHPLPGIAGHVVKTIAVRREGSGRQCALGPTGFGADHRKSPLL